MKRGMQSLGPWSTSLDAGLRLELSAFWKRRMTALVTLPLASQKLRRRCLAAALATIALLAATPLVEFPTGAAAKELAPEKKGADEAGGGAPRPADQPAKFGDVIERTVNDNGHGEYLVDFDSGKLFEEPDGRRFESEREFIAWARSQGIDAMGQVKSSYKGLVGFDMIVIPTDADSWDQRVGGVLEALEVGDPGTPAAMDARAELPATFFITTREGGRGVLQIVGIEEDNDQPGPDQVRVRYKPIAAIALEEQAQTRVAPSAHAVGAPKRGPFVAKFSNGVEVELIGVSENPSKDRPWWRPDGSPLPERPYADVRARMGSGLPREICFRWRNLPKDPDYTLSWNTVPAYEGAGGGPVDAKGRPVKGLWATAIGLPGSPETCTVQFSTSVSATRWKTVFSDDGRHYSSAGSAVDGKPRGVIWSPARQEGDELLITVSYKAPGEAVRLVAVDKGGQEHPAPRIRGGGSWDFMQQTFAFDDLPLGEVERFEMQTQTREIETVEFINVSLEPDKITNVETRLAPEAEPAKPRAAKSTIEFEPVVERVVNDDDPERGKFLIDFETGELHSPPADLKSPKEQFAWIASRGIDATGELSTSVQGLIGFDMIVLPTIADNWDPTPVIFGQVDDGKPGTPATFSGRGELPATFLFKTREGVRGVLQILEKNGHDSLKVRYKLEKTDVR